MSNEYYNNNDPLIPGTLAKALDLNTDRDRLEVAFDLLPTLAEMGILNGLTATTAELNIMDGVTASTAEINILDGVTATTAEINHVDGVTSSLQTQIDSKAAIAGQVYTGTHDFTGGHIVLDSLVEGETLDATTDNDRLATTSFVQSVRMYSAVPQTHLYFFSQL